MDKKNIESKSIKICNVCVMTDKGDPLMHTDDNGQCNYCCSAVQRKSKEYYPNEYGSNLLAETLATIKENCRNDQYDCMMGISGGLDSSYLAYLGHRWGLRILGVHIDDGYDTPTAKDNVQKIADYCNIKLINICPDESQYNDLLLAFMKASVPNIAIPQDNILTASLYRFAAEHHIRYFLSGFNFPLESILQGGNTHPHGDKAHIKAIGKKFGTLTYDKLPMISTRQIADMRKKLKIQTIYPLNFINYNKNQAIAELKEHCDYNYYEAKHFESIFTRFMQTCWLPQKFEVDKRRSHFSSLIIDGQMSREEALAELEKPPIRKELLEADKAFICRKMNISITELEALIALPPKSHTDYHIDISLRIRRVLSKIKHDVLHL